MSGLRCTVDRPEPFARAAALLSHCASRFSLCGSFLVVRLNLLVVQLLSLSHCAAPFLLRSFFLVVWLFLIVWLLSRCAALQLAVEIIAK